jgi:hypothetical protein
VIATKDTTMSRARHPTNAAASVQVDRHASPAGLGRVVEPPHVWQYRASAINCAPQDLQNMLATIRPPQRRPHQKNPSLAPRIAGLRARPGLSGDHAEEGPDGRGWGGITV